MIFIPASSVSRGVFDQNRGVPTPRAQLFFQHCAVRRSPTDPTSLSSHTLCCATTSRLSRDVQSQQRTRSSIRPAICMGLRESFLTSYLEQSAHGRGCGPSSLSIGCHTVLPVCG